MKTSLLHTEPWGTPMLTVQFLNIISPTLSYCSRSLRELVVNGEGINLLYLIDKVSKPFLKSRNIPNMSNFLFMESEINYISMHWGNIYCWSTNNMKTRKIYFAKSVIDSKIYITTGIPTSVVGTCFWGENLGSGQKPIYLLQFQSLLICNDV